MEKGTGGVMNIEKLIELELGNLISDHALEAALEYLHRKGVDCADLSAVDRIELMNLIIAAVNENLSNIALDYSTALDNGMEDDALPNMELSFRLLGVEAAKRYFDLHRATQSEN